jgi:hypothetical protein
VAGKGSGPGVDEARRVSQLLEQLANADTATRARADAAVVTPLRIALDDLRLSLHPDRVTLQTLPTVLGA